jgi:histidine ammonia-lyase
VLAIELMCAAEGVGHRAPLNPGPGVAAVVDAVRRVVPPLGEDRSAGADIEKLADWIEAGHATDLLGEVRLP